MGKIDETLEKLKDCGYVELDYVDIDDMIKEGEEQVDVEDIIIAVTDHNRKCLMDYADARFKEIDAKIDAKIEKANTEFFKAMAEFGISGELAEAIADAVSKKAKEEVAKKRKEKNTEDTALMDLIKEIFG